jgi:hypothetical protein
MALRNLRSVARNYREAGAVRIVLAGVLETRVERDRCQEALEIPLSVCRLRADLALVRSRLAHRHRSEEAALDWYLSRARELDLILEAAHVEDFTVAVTDLSLTVAAEAVIRAVGWEGGRVLQPQPVTRGQRAEPPAIS